MPVASVVAEVNPLEPFLFVGRLALVLCDVGIHIYRKRPLQSFARVSGIRNVPGPNHRYRQQVARRRADKYLIGALQIGWRQRFFRYPDTGRVSFG